MKKANNTIAKAVKNLAGFMAEMGYGSASVWGMHQMKEPTKRVKKNSK